MSKIALSMIVRGNDEEARNLDRALSSVAKYVDAIYITLTGNDEETSKILPVCLKYKANVSYYKKKQKITKEVVDWVEQFLGAKPQLTDKTELFLFDEARNYNMSQIPKDYDWMLWLDCDDVLVGGDKLKLLADAGLEKGIEAFYFNYIYQAEFDEKGNITNVIIKHLRERLVRNTGVFKWIAPIHETLIEQRPTEKTDTDECVVVHMANMEDRMSSLQRNLKNLEYTIYTTKGEDPRHVYYLAKAYFDLNTEEYDKQAIRLIENYYLSGDHQSGWAEERAQAAEYVGEMYRRRGQSDKALAAEFRAIAEDPENPSLYLSLARTYVEKQMWERALFWVRVSSNIPERKTTLVHNPKDIQGRTLEIIYNCALNLGKVDEAWAAIVKLKELFPENTSVEPGYQLITNIRTQRDLTKQYVEICDYLKKSGEQAKIKALLASAPQLIISNPFIMNLYQQNMPPKPWGDKEIAIYCGPGFTNWSPKQLTDPKESFVGGSEEAVIRMSIELQKLGWSVTVYADPGNDEGVHDGVNWLPYYKFNRLDNFNILIGWRDVRFFDTDFSAKKKYLWCHDIQNPLEFTEDRVNRIDKVFFLSKWQRSHVESLPDSKVLLTSNGI